MKKSNTKHHYSCSCSKCKSQRHSWNPSFSARVLSVARRDKETKISTFHGIQDLSQASGGSFAQLWYEELIRGIASDEFLGSQIHLNSISLKLWANMQGGNINFATKPVRFIIAYPRKSFAITNAALNSLTDQTSIYFKMDPHIYVVWYDETFFLQTDVPGIANGNTPNWYVKNYYRKLNSPYTISFNDQQVSNFIAPLLYMVAPYTDDPLDTSEVLVNFLMTVSYTDS